MDSITSPIISICRAPAFWPVCVTAPVLRFRGIAVRGTPFLLAIAFPRNASALLRDHSPRLLRLAPPEQYLTQNWRSVSSPSQSPWYSLSAGKPWSRQYEASASCSAALQTALTPGGNNFRSYQAALWKKLREWFSAEFSSLEEVDCKRTEGLCVRERRRIPSGHTEPWPIVRTRGWHGVIPSSRSGSVKRSAKSACRVDCPRRRM